MPPALTPWPRLAEAWWVYAAAAPSRWCCSRSASSTRVRCGWAVQRLAAAAPVRPGLDRRAAPAVHHRPVRRGRCPRHGRAGPPQRGRRAHLVDGDRGDRRRRSRLAKLVSVALRPPSTGRAAADPARSACCCAGWRWAALTATGRPGEVAAARPIVVALGCLRGGRARAGRRHARRSHAAHGHVGALSAAACDLRRGVGRGADGAARACVDGRAGACRRARTPAPDGGGQLGAAAVDGELRPLAEHGTRSPSRPSRRRRPPAVGPTATAPAPPRPRSARSCGCAR